jgi:uncharacterized membrane protein YsdA (DUF1294 family)
MHLYAKPPTAVIGYASIFERFSLRYLSILAFAALAVWLQVPVAIAAVYAAASLLTFALYALDKRAAIRRDRRTPERTLLAAGLACGWPGAALAQQWLRHKSSKASFLVWFWLSVIANAGLLLLLVRGADWL